MRVELCFQPDFARKVCVGKIAYNRPDSEII
jgi:hypothetical protein